MIRIWQNPVFYLTFRAMHLFARDRQHEVVFVNQAAKHSDYYCIECGSVVRLRGGLHRQSHYFHINPNRSCRLNGKSMAHLQIQYRLQKIFSPEDCELEHRFPAINRIADVVWLSGKLVFEIQCSLISAEEVRNRNKDYESVGYRVFWILHDFRYNQWRQTALENFLLYHPHYFTNINAEGEGMIYDQFALSRKGVYQCKQAPLFVDLSQAIPFDKAASFLNPKNTPQVIFERTKSWPLCFAGDLLSLHLLSSEKGALDSYIEEALQSEVKLQQEFRKTSTPSKSFIREVWHRYIVRFYRIVFHMLLEKACK